VESPPSLQPSRRSVSSSGALPAVSIVVMAYNEAKNLPAVVTDIGASLCAAGVPYEVLIVDDGSTDETPTVCAELQEASPCVRTIRHAANRGLGGVYRTGFAEARGEYVTFLPGDGQFAAEVVTRFYQQIGDVDMVLGYYPPAERPFVGRVLSKCEQALHRVALGKTPKFQGVFMFRRSLLGGLTLRSEGRGWGVLFEFILKVDRSGFRVRTVPTSLRPRLSGASKVNNVKTIVGNLVQIYRLRRLLGRTPW
jgi:dolichol-phosphate mannosyltransferase